MELGSYLRGTARGTVGWEGSAEACWSDTKMNWLPKCFTATANTSLALSSFAEPTPSPRSLGEQGHQYSHHNRGVFLILVLQARG